MKIDLYTKIILTVIALSLIGLLIRPLLFPVSIEAQTSRGVVDINLVEIQGYPVYGMFPLPVKIIRAPATIKFPDGSRTRIEAE